MYVFKYGYLSWSTPQRSVRCPQPYPTCQSLGSVLLLEFGSLVLELLLLGLNGLDISGDEEVDHDVPVPVLELAPEELDLSGEHPIDDGNGLGDSIVAGDDDVNVVEGGISVAEGDARDVDIASLVDGLLVTLGIRHDQQPGLLELLRGLVGQGSWDPPRRRGSSGAGVLAELVDSTLSLSLGADDLGYWETVR
jgi:hypothetical protein